MRCKKRGSVLRDADGFYVSGGKSRHTGIEAGIDWAATDYVRLRANATYAKHTYDFDFVGSRGETFVSGNDVDTAPRWLGSLELFVNPSDRTQLALQWTSLGRYFLDAENRFTYPGHDVVNLRGRFDVSERVAFSLRVNNALDTAIADRADYAFGDYRYFPGRGRELFVELRYAE